MSTFAFKDDWIIISSSIGTARPPSGETLAWATSISRSRVSTVDGLGFSDKFDVEAMNSLESLVHTVKQLNLKRVHVDELLLVPEQLHKCDIWAFGLCVWEILADGKKYLECSGSSNLIYKRYPPYTNSLTVGTSPSTPIPHIGPPDEGDQPILGLFDHSKVENLELPGNIPFSQSWQLMPFRETSDTQLNTPMLLNAPPMAGGQASSIPLTRVMNALGSRSNDQHFIVLPAGLNGLKTRMWRIRTPHDGMTSAIAADDPTQALQNIRSVIAVMNYLNDPRVRPHMVSTSNEVRREFGLADQRWVASGNDAVYAQDWWDQWIRDRHRHIGTVNNNWAIGQIADMRRIWAVRTGENVTPVLEVLDEYKAAAQKSDIDTDDLD
ncbi:hypothetical protein N7449_006998 [Penicillium cf. viridicatum]|uniref:Protein kinase domain-containing protein n=1 Tax=Penicillium cf. viridicatum TaxID=2972119 RepID=A0A9W9JHM9_9EURO|nr:hypothetical protein N7449_006998 [Penicillium cf. viridicatum]